MGFLACSLLCPRLRPASSSSLCLHKTAPSGPREPPDKSGPFSRGSGRCWDRQQRSEWTRSRRRRGKLGQGDPEGRGGGGEGPVTHHPRVGAGCSPTGMPSTLTVLQTGVWPGRQGTDWLLTLQALHSCSWGVFSPDISLSDTRASRQARELGAQWGVCSGSCGRLPSASAWRWRGVSGSGDIIRCPSRLVDRCAAPEDEPFHLEENQAGVHAQGPGHAQPGARN